MKDKIDEQVEQAPLTKEESKAQFYQITEMLGLKHSFNFDEAWEIGEEIRRRKDFRENISILEDAVVNAEGGMKVKSFMRLIQLNTRSLVVVI